MKRRGHGIGGYIKSAAVMIVSVLSVCAVCSWAINEMPSLLVKAASFSAALSMPEAVMQQLKERFDSEIQPEPQAEPQQCEERQPQAMPPNIEPTPTVEAVMPQDAEKDR